MQRIKFGLAAVIIMVISAAAVKAESNESGDASKPGSKTRYRHLTLEFDWSIISTEDAPGGNKILPGLHDTAIKNAFRLMRIGYYSHRGGKGIVGYGYKVNIGIAISGNVSVKKGPQSVFRNEPRFDSYRYGFGKQIHVGQFFGVSFKIIDKGPIRWFAAAGLAMDIMGGIPFTPDRLGLLLGPEVNSYVTYMFNPSFGLSLSGKFTYYALDAVSLIMGRKFSAPSGGFGVFLTFAS